ncbi:DUF4020 domain-containing protein [Legionella resiliens]|uniref:DUF4020 domain-containing protein n=1 Tax=Legionella resiliens TaxID=2905958 RepID=A0ABS8WZM7_9GAMM|nr:MULTISPECIES: DUF4020 domain-containing protein [unclassified Legionella]MCE0722793.1 DUF4020 domain-containing protein [Legionella sp. 9fVS26]MCE3531946.1 DUF4020 domain-containing protein [Legionella sp. 8cVS16]
MIINGVDFPVKVIEALKHNRLVVFAGAGVSMGKPANLPCFYELARQIARGTGLEPQSNGNDLDYFLGNLGIDDLVIRNRASELTTIDENKFTPLHTAIVKLFKRPTDVRIVTTNFDLLFQFAATAIWANPPQIYTAPALPLGHDFEGIVDIHGSRRFPKSIVLTDRDFGKAYLTEGWARRFLVSLFENYIVLFIGYSHNDIVMRYLARSLPDKSLGSRFAMIGNDEEKEYWHTLGIEPISFQKTSKSDFSHLHLSLEKLSEFIHRPPSEWREIFWNLAESKPEHIDLEDRDHLLSMCNDESKFRYFTQKAIDPDWIYWLDSNKAIPDIFSDSSQPEMIRICVDWLVGFVNKQPECIFYLLNKHGYKAGQYFWNRLTKKISEIEDHQLFIRWVDLLVQIAPYYVCEYSLSWIAESSHKLGLFECLYKIYEVLANTKITLRESSYRTSSKILPELETQASHWCLNQIRDEYLQSWYDNHATQLLDLCTELLIKRRQLSLNWSIGDDKYDPDSWRRSAIEPHEQDKFPESIDVIIDTAKEAIDTMTKTNPKNLSYWIKNNKNSTSLIIQRLCLYSINISKIKPEKKVAWLLEKGLHNSSYRHEAFVLLRDNYNQLNDQFRQKVILEIKKYDSHVDKDKDEVNAYEQFQWLAWLQENCIDCQLLSNEIAFIHEKYPELTIRSYPDLTMWLESDNYNPQSPWSAQELLTIKNDNGFQKIINFKIDKSKEFSMQGLLWAISDAVKDNKDWGIAFCNFLIKKNQIDSQFFPVILNELKNWPENPENSSAIISILNEIRLQNKYPKELSEILLGAVKQGGVPYLSNIADQLNIIAQTLWNNLNKSKEPFSNSEKNFYSAAINTTEGNLATYWINALYCNSKINIETAFNTYKENLTALCSTVDPKTAYTIPIICAELNYLFSLDENWSRNTIMPIFTDKDSQRVIQAWHGFLSSSGPSLLVFTTLKDIVLNMLPQIYNLLPTRIERFIEFYVVMIFWYINDPNDLWLPKLLDILEEKERLVLSQRIKYFLQNIDDDKVISNWDSWLKLYWQNRIKGIPKDLNNSEIQCMLCWLPYLGEKFPEAVEIATKMKSAQFDQKGSFLHLEENDFPTRFPEATAKLLIYLFECKTSPFFLYNIDNILDKLSMGEISDKILKSLNESLIKSGRNPISLKKL